MLSISHSLEISSCSPPPLPEKNYAVQEVVMENSSLLEHILSFVSPSDLNSSSLVNRSWYLATTRVVQRHASENVNQLIRFFIRNLNPEIKHNAIQKLQQTPVIEIFKTTSLLTVKHSLDKIRNSMIDTLSEIEPQDIKKLLEFHDLEKGSDKKNLALSRERILEVASICQDIRAAEMIIDDEERFNKLLDLAFTLAHLREDIKSFEVISKTIAISRTCVNISRKNLFFETLSKKLTQLGSELKSRSYLEESLKCALNISNSCQKIRCLLPLSHVMINDSDKSESFEVLQIAIHETSTMVDEIYRYKAYFELSIKLEQLNYPKEAFNTFEKSVICLQGIKPKSSRNMEIKKFKDQFFKSMDELRTQTLSTFSTLNSFKLEDEISRLESKVAALSIKTTVGKKMLMRLQKILLY